MITSYFSCDNDIISLLLLDTDQLAAIDIIYQIFCFFVFKNMIVAEKCLSLFIDCPRY